MSRSVHPRCRLLWQRRAAIEAEELQLNEARDLALQRVKDAEAAETVSVPAAADCC